MATVNHFDGDPPPHGMEALYVIEEFAWVLTYRNQWTWMEDPRETFWLDWQRAVDFEIDCEHVGSSQDRW